MSALQVDDLVVSYGPVVAIDGISFTTEPGACTAVLGVNGAGKSSLAGAIVGWIRPARGGVVLNGIDITGLKPTHSVAAGVALVPERRQLFSPLSVKQNLTLGGYRRTRSERSESLDRALDMFPDLSGRLDDRAGDLSGGQQQMLAIARAMMSSPKVVILDEPSLGLAPLAVRDLSKRLRQIIDDGTALLVVEQNSRLALELANDVIVLNQGTVATQGPAEEVLSSNEELLNMFLGHD